MRPGDDLGTVVHGDTLSFERDFGCDADRLWRAVTEPAQLTSWMGFPISVEPRVGGRIHFDFGPDDDAHGVITEFEAPHLFEHTFIDGKTRGPASLCRWEIEPIPNGCRLVFTHGKLDPDRLPGLGGGWHAFFESLANHLDGGHRPDRFEQLTKLYAQRLP